MSNAMSAGAPCRPAATCGASQAPVHASRSSSIGGVMASVILVAAVAVGVRRDPRARRRCSWSSATARLKPVDDLVRHPERGQSKRRSCSSRSRMTVRDPRALKRRSPASPSRSWSSSSSSPDRDVVKQLRRRREHDRNRIRDERPTRRRTTQARVILLQPYGSLFFASAATFTEALPAAGGPHRSTRGDPSPARHRRPRREHHHRGRALGSDLAGADSKLLLNGGEQLRARLAKSGAARPDRDTWATSPRPMVWHVRTLSKADVDARN